MPFPQKIMNNPLLFFTKNDIPYNSANLIIHTPTVNELGLISEESFRIAYQMIVHLPEITKSQDKTNSFDKSDFDIFIAMINSEEKQNRTYKKHLLSMFSLLFPNYSIRVREKDIQFMDTTGSGNVTFLDNNNFQEFQEIIINMFSTHDNGSGSSYNPADTRAKMIADKLNKAKKKNSQSEVKKISVYKRYASVLSIGLSIDLNTILDYSVAQIEDQFSRYILKVKWDANMSARLAGATDLDDAEDWMKEI